MLLIMMMVVAEKSVGEISRVSILFTVCEIMMMIIFQ